MVLLLARPGRLLYFGVDDGDIYRIKPAEKDHLLLPLSYYLHRRIWTIDCYCSTAVL